MTGDLWPTLQKKILLGGAALMFLKGTGKHTSHICRGNSLRKLICSCIVLYGLASQAATPFNTHISISFSWMSTSPPKKALLSWNEFSDASQAPVMKTVNLLLDKPRQKNIPVSQGHLHTIVISSTMATKDRNGLGNVPAFREWWKGGGGHQFE